MQLGGGAIHRPGPSVAEPSPIGRQAAIVLADQGERRTPEHDQVLAAVSTLLTLALDNYDPAMALCELLGPVDKGPRGENRPGVRRSLPELIGDSAPMQSVKRLLLRASECDANVVLTGETGTGKGLCAAQVHRKSSRHGKPFVTVDGTLLHDELALSQLFGHVKGAFTGALEAHHGLVHEADGGTLFIDEIGDASQRVQSALLRLVEERRFQRLGDTCLTPVDCRIICATRRNLREMGRTGEFREDLLWRIRCVEIFLPPLRERGNDVLLLTDSFLDELAERNGTRYILDETARLELCAHRWPGNVRELRQRLERAALFAANGVLTGALLGLPAREVSTTVRGETCSLDDLERQSILQALQRSGGNQRQAARMLGIAESSLRSKLHKHAIGLDPPGEHEPDEGPSPREAPDPLTLRCRACKRGPTSQRQGRAARPRRATSRPGAPRR